MLTDEPHFLLFDATDHEEPFSQSSLSELAKMLTALDHLLSAVILDWSKQAKPGDVFALDDKLCFVCVNREILALNGEMLKATSC